MNKTDIKYFEEIIVGLFNEEEKSLNINHEVSLQEEKFYAENQDFTDTMKKISDVEAQLKELGETKTTLYKTLERIYREKCGVYYSPSFYSLNKIKDDLHAYFYRKVNDHFEDYETGRKILELRAEKRNALLALRLIRCDNDIKEFLDKLFKRFGKSLPI